jgi:hypothetical protein
MPRLKRPSARFSGVLGSCSVPWLKRLVTVLSGVLGLRSMPRLKRPVNHFCGVSGSCSMPWLKRRVPVGPSAVC